MKPGSSEPPTMRAVIPVTLAGLRSDQALAWVFPEYSRTTLKSWILAGRVQVDGRCVEPRHVVSGGEAVELAPPPPSATLSILGREHPEAIPIEVIHEDPEIRVVNKPAGLVVHPGAGNREGTSCAMRFLYAVVGVLLDALSAVRTATHGGQKLAALGLEASPACARWRKVATPSRSSPPSGLTAAGHWAGAGHRHRPRQSTRS